MDVTGMNTQLLTQTLVESFNALADEVQNLSDRQTVLEHKLRYAHEQVIFFFFFFSPLSLSLSLLLYDPPSIPSLIVSPVGSFDMPYRRTRRR